MKAFGREGGRLLKMAMIFTMVCLIVIAIQATFMKMAMNQVYEIATMELKKEEIRPEVPAFYTMILPMLAMDSIVTALSVVITAVIVRYGAREATKNIAEGSKYKAEFKAGGGTVETSEEISK